MQHHPHRRARRGQVGRVPLRGRDRRLRRLPEPEQGPDPEEDHLPRGRDQRGRGRGRDAVELLLPGVRVLVRQQHQHDRGRLAPERLPLGADQRAEQVRAREGRAAREGRQPHRRGRPRGADRRHLGQAHRSPVRGSDQDQARQPRHAGLRPLDRQRAPGRVPGGEPPGGPRRPAQGRLRRPGPRRRAQGPRPHPPQVGAGELDAAGQARRLLGQGSVAGRAVRRRGRLRRRLGGLGPRPAARRRSCRCAARSSTSRRAGSTRCSATPRSRR